jgi:tetratricopeptide (TPR) repeat protein
MPRSVSLHPDHKKTARLALERNGFLTQGEFSVTLRIALSTVSLFFNCKPVSTAKFEQICEKLNLDKSKITQPIQSDRRVFAPSIFNADTWVGRGLIVDELLAKLQGNTRLLWITGISGIGKTTLGKCLASQAWDRDPSFQWIYLEILDEKTLDFASVAANLLVDKLGDRDLNPQERNNPEQLARRLLQKLKSHPYWIQIDSLERLLNSEQPTGFVDPYWVNFLRSFLTDSGVVSRFVLTSQAFPAGLIEFSDRYPTWSAHPLDGLLKVEQLEFFAKHGVIVDHLNRDTLTRIATIYEGHPLVLKVIADDILKRYAGDVSLYWQAYQPEFDQVAREPQATRLDETEYNEALDRKVRDRIKKSIEKVPTDALDLLCRSSVFRRPVPKKFWLAMIGDRTPQQQKVAYRILGDSALIEKENINIRQHNLIRSVAYDLLKTNTSTWKQTELQAANLWLNVYEPKPDFPNLEKLRGYLEAFEHYYSAQDWDAAQKIAEIRVDTIAETCHISKDYLEKYLFEQLGHWGYYREQQSLYKKLLNIAEQLSDLQKKACASDYLGCACSSLGQYEEATKLHKQSQMIFHEIGLPDQEAQVLRHLGHARNILGKYQEAIDYFTDALNIFETKNDPIGKVETLNELGTTYHCKGEYQRSRKYIFEALKISRDLSDDKLKAKSLNNLGNPLKSLGKYQKAIKFLKQSLEIAGERYVRASALKKLGIIYRCLGQYNKSIRHLEESLEISKNIGSVYIEARSLNNLGITYYCLGQYNTSIEYHQEALKISKNMRDRGQEARSLGNLGHTYNALGNYGKAIDYLNESLAITQRLGNIEVNAETYMGLGNTYLANEDYSNAIDFLNKSLEIQLQIGHCHGKTTTLNRLGNVYYALSQYEQASEYYQQSLVLAQRIGSRRSEGYSLVGIGQIQLKLEWFSESLTHSQIAFDIFREIGDEAGKAEALKNLAELHQAQGEVEAARRFCQKALELAIKLGIPLAADCQTLMQELENGA